MPGGPEGGQHSSGGGHNQEDQPLLPSKLASLTGGTCDPDMDTIMVHCAHSTVTLVVELPTQIGWLTDTRIQLVLPNLDWLG